MKRFLLGLSVSFIALVALGQTAPVRTLETRADLIARVSTRGETIAVRNFSTNVLWAAPRTFVEYDTSVITNANDGVHYITNARPNSIYVSNDRLAEVQDAAWWGAAGDVTTDDTVALNAAAAYAARYIDESAFTTLKGPGRGRLLIRPTPTGYLITNTVNIRASVDAAGAALVYRGPTNTAYNALLVAPANPTSTFINNHIFNLPDVWGWDRGFDHTNSVGIRVQGIGRSTINFPYVYRFYKAVEFLCDTEAVTLSTFTDGFLDTCHIGASAVITNGGYFNGNTWYGMRVNNENGNFSSNITNNFEIVRMENFGGSLNGNSWIGGSWEGFVGQRVVYIKNGSANLFTGMRLEHHVGDHTFNAELLHMEVESDTVGTGIDNHITWPNQGVNGMNGLQVKETGLAYGNSGGSSQWTEYRTRDNGYNHGPIVLTESTNAVGQAMMSMYASMTWPTNHFSNYDQWRMILASTGERWKQSTDQSFRLWIEPNGNITQAVGGSSYQPLGVWSGGMLDGYDDSQIRRLRFDRYGTIRWYNNLGVETAALAPYYGSTWGGMRFTSVPTNLMDGFTFIKELTTSTVNNSHYAFPGIELIAGSLATNYLTATFGAFSPNHPYAYIQDRVGFYVDSDPITRTNTSPVAYGANGFRIALRPVATHFEITRGETVTPSFKIDYSTTAGQTRAWIWDAASAGPQRIMNTSNLLHFSTLPNPITGLIASTGGSAGRVLSYVNSNSFAWSNAPSSFSFSDLTNAIVAGSNVSISYTSTNMTISSSGGGGATNGTAVSVDGGSALSFANFADASKIGFSASGSNITATIVADSLGLADLDATTEAYFLNRTNHTGTQNWTTIHSTPTTRSGYGITDAQPLDTDLTRIADVTWALGDLVYRDSTGLTNFATTAAGRTLMAAVNEAAQRTALSITNYQGGVGVQLTGTNFSHNIAAGTNIVLTTNGNQLVINTPGGGSGTAVLVNGTNVSNPNFRRFFGITDSTNVDLLLSAGTNVTFTTNGNTLTINATAGTGVSTNIPIVRTLLVSGNAVTNSTANTSETNQIATLAMGSTNVAANTASAGTTYRLRAFGRLSAASTDYEGTFRFKVGGVTASVSFSEPHSYQPTSVGWQLEANITVLGTGSSAAAQVYGNLIWQGDAENQDTLGAILRDVTGSGTFNTTAAATLEFTYQNDATNPLTLITSGATIELLGQDTQLTGGSGSGGGTTNLVSTTTNGLAPAITRANGVLGTDASSNVTWIAGPFVGYTARNGLTNSASYFNALDVTVPGGTLTQDGEELEYAVDFETFNDTASPRSLTLQITAGGGTPLTATPFSFATSGSLVRKGVIIGTIRRTSATQATISGLYSLGADNGLSTPIQYATPFLIYGNSWTWASNTTFRVRLSMSVASTFFWTRGEGSIHR